MVAAAWWAVRSRRRARSWAVWRLAAVRHWRRREPPGAPLHRLAPVILRTLECAGYVRTTRDAETSKRCGGGSDGGKDFHDVTGGA
jgi:hypothetical protein